jgi:heme o synthase
MKANQSEHIIALKENNKSESHRSHGGRDAGEVVSALYEMTKPGITKMVALTASAGYYLALPSGSSFFTQENLLRFMMMNIGTVLVSGSSCVFNNVLEQNYDRLMQRTARRALPTGLVKVKEAIVFGALIGFLGVIALATINMITLLLAVATFITYVVIYTPMKRQTHLNTIVGAIPGALPPLGGFTAVSGAIDPAGIVLFLILFAWQMPHFLSLSWMYKEDYARGGYKMLAVMDDTGKNLARQTLMYATALMPVCLLLPALGHVHWVFGVGSIALCTVFMVYSVKFYRDVSRISARKVLLSSYLFLTGVILLIFVTKM